jgi:hypothetical protein
VVRARMPGRRRGLTALTATEGGGFDRSPAGGEIPRRFSAVGPVLRRGGGGEARAGAGDHGGGANLTGGGLWRWWVSAAVMSPVRLSEGSFYRRSGEGEGWRGRRAPASSP